MIKTPLSTVLGGAFWTPGCTVIGGNTPTFDQQILKLFANGEQGFFYDPNDLSTMYQDAAGTIPVTAVGQAVGLIRDKSGRNNHAYQTTSASRPILRKNAVTGANYLEFDGSDDFLVTNSIDFTGTNKVSLFAGVRKLTDSSPAVVIELSETSVTNNGTFALQAPLTANSGFGFRSKATSTAANALTDLPLSPASVVLSGFGSISENSSRLRIDGVLVSGNNTPQGTGNYGNYRLYIGRRGGSSNPLNGHIYSLIGIGRLTTDAETVALEKLIAKNTGVTLSV